MARLTRKPVLRRGAPFSGVERGKFVHRVVPKRGTLTNRHFDFLWNNTIKLYFRRCVRVVVRTYNVSFSSNYSSVYWKQASSRRRSRFRRVIYVIFDLASSSNFQPSESLAFWPSTTRSFSSQFFHFPPVQLKRI